MHLYPPHFVSKFAVELKDVIWRNCSVTWLFVKNLVLPTRERMEHSHSVVIREV